MEQQNELVLHHGKEKRKDKIDFKLKSTMSFQHLVLIINSSHYCAQISSSLIQNIGYATRIALSPAAAIKMLRKDLVKPDLILVELADLKDSALHFPKRFSQFLFKNSIPTLASSAMTDSRVFAHLIKSGFVDYIQAPASSALIKLKFETAIRKSYVSAA